MSEHTTPPPDSWYERADAMNTVADLALDDTFRDFFETHRVRQVTVWHQDPNYPIACEVADFMPCFDGNPDRVMAFRDVVGSHVVTVSDCDLSVACLPIVTDNQTTKQRLFSGSLILNGQRFTAEHEANHVQLRGDAPARHSLAFTPSEFTYFLTTLALHDDSRRGQLDDTIMQTMMSTMSATNNDWDKVGCALQGLGNINGAAQDIQAAVFHDEQEAFVSYIKHHETPYQSSIEHFIQAHETTPLFVEQFGIDTVQFAIPSPDETNRETAFTRAAPTCSTLTFAQNALRHQCISELSDSSISYYPSSGDIRSARDYATICIAFLNLLNRAYATATQP
ncbi:MAG: hypothetical protein Q4F02_02395 [Candidatus Saccharibacteria bacterium]|nr:hypothetical protein [Candidatus Saccharibacteria bacterium]